MDYDWIIVGSGFGGSVSALRLAEKGYSVAVIEAGRRFEDEDFAEPDVDRWRKQGRAVDCRENWQNRAKHDSGGDSEFSDHGTYSWWRRGR